MAMAAKESQYTVYATPWCLVNLKRNIEIARIRDTCKCSNDN